MSIRTLHDPLLLVTLEPLGLTYQKITCKLQQNFDNVQQQNNSNLKYLSNMFNQTFTFGTTIEFRRTRKKFIPTNYNRFVMSCDKVQLDELMNHNKISTNNNKVQALMNDSRLTTYVTKLASIYNKTTINTQQTNVQMLNIVNNL